VPRFWQSVLQSWFWPAATLAAVSLHFWFPEAPTGTAHDTYSATAAGHKAFYRLVLQQPDCLYVGRNHRPLSAFLQTLSATETLCILGPERPPSQQEWSDLVDWIRNGGSLVYAFTGDKPQEIPWLKVRFIPEPEIDDSLEPQTKLVASDELAWWTDGRIEVPQGTPLVHYHETLQAVRVRYGTGAAVLIAGPLPFSNQALTFGDNSVLAIRLLEAARVPEFVVFDESLNSSGTAKTIGILFDPLIRPVTIQILILTMLFGWWQSRRFGPRIPVAVSARQNIVEHTDMVGNWYWKSQDGKAALTAYLRQLSSTLRLRTFRGQEDRVLQPIARRSGRPVAELRQEIQQAYQVARSKRVERRQAARQIRQLAVIRQAAQINASGIKNKE
jgi:hypothetical protein